MKTSRFKRIAITTGDTDGIGTEVTYKALSRIGPQQNICFIVWRSKDCPQSHLKYLKNKFNILQVKNWKEAIEIPFDKNNLIDICSNEPPPHWVEICASAGMKKQISALVTGPLSKTSIHASGLKDMGHTGILKRITKTTDLFMCFIGSKFNVLLITDHIPIKKIRLNLNESKIIIALKIANQLKCILPKKFKNKPLALLGLNPHSGEEGLIGNEEITLFKNVTHKTRLNINGPLVPDAAFFKENWSQFSFFVCPYHDQGLIPFKMIHGQSEGVHITAGLPFVRTSVDHGTAKNLFNKNKANFGSMYQSILLAIRLSERKNYIPS